MLAAENHLRVEVFDNNRRGPPVTICPHSTNIAPTHPPDRASSLFPPHADLLDLGCTGPITPTIDPSDPCAAPTTLLDLLDIWIYWIYWI